MPTTTYMDSTFSVAAIGSRTDASGSAVDDYTAEEARFPLEILSAGYLKPTDAFKVSAQDVPNMSVLVGSESAKADFYVLEGASAGQGNYLVRLDDVSETVTLGASDPSQTRIDEVYLVVQDNVYDASGRALPRFGYRKGDAGGVAPGPDSSWEAYALLATVTVAAAATEVESADITDERERAQLLDSLAPEVDTSAFILKSTVDAKGDLLVGAADNTVSRLAAGTNGKILRANSGASAGLEWGGWDPKRYFAATDDTDDGPVLAEMTLVQGKYLFEAAVAWANSVGVTFFFIEADAPADLVMFADHYGESATAVDDPDQFVEREYLTGSEIGGSEQVLATMGGPAAGSVGRPSGLIDVQSASSTVRFSLASNDTTLKKGSWLQVTRVA